MAHFFVKKRTQVSGRICTNHYNRASMRFNFFVIVRGYLYLDYLLFVAVNKVPKNSRAR